MQVLMAATTLSYVSQTKLVRFLVDVTLKQDGLYEYLSDPCL